MARRGKSRACKRCNTMAKNGCGKRSRLAVAHNVSERFWQGVWIALPWGILGWIALIVALAWLNIL